MKPANLDYPLIEFSTNAGLSSWTLRDAVEGTQIFGGIGSGKTSGSGQLLALKFLKAGYGGLVLTVKPDERDQWQRYCDMTGRSDDLLVIEPGGKHSFNFLDYEARKSETNEAMTDNIVQVLKTVIEAGAEKESKGDDSFWESALDMLIFNTIDLCKMAYGTLSVQTMYDIVQSLPKPGDEKKAETATEKTESLFDQTYNLAYDTVIARYNTWWKSLSDDQQMHYEADERMRDQAAEEAIPDARLLKYLHEFFFESFKNLSQKTRSIVEFIFLGFLFRLLRDPVYSLFCKNQSNITPEDSLKGKIILINLPVKTFNKVGRDCQILFKYIWQRAMEKRRIIKDVSQPVFLWADEAQNFLHEHDAEYQATARSSLIATVYISQNMPNYYASMGGQRAEYRVKSFLGTLGTKIFHANADIETNRYASDLIGDVLMTTPSMTITVGGDVSQSSTISTQIDKHVRPEKFVSQKTGGPRNNYRVEGYMHKQGNCINGERNFVQMTFNQNTLV